MTVGSKTATYAYDADGIRTQKTVDGVTHTYYTLNGKLMRESFPYNGSTFIMDFIYDESGKPFALSYSSNGGESFYVYYYGVNAQGDVEKIFGFTTNEETGEEEEYVFGYYTYDAWGNVTAHTRSGGTPSTTSIVYRNPIRYRGYVYDNETGWYYLQSRYYDPANHRFINADSYASTGQGLLGYNMFAYCGNNPSINSDQDGKRRGHANEIAKKKREAAEEEYNEATVNIYVEGNGEDDNSKLNVRFYVADAEKGYTNISIDKSLEITDVYEMRAVLSVIVKSDYYDEETYGSIDYMVGQWIAHNACYDIASGSALGYTFMQRISGSSNPIESAKSLDLRCKGNITRRQKLVYTVAPFLDVLLS